jgi:hypothetical protein
MRTISMLTLLLIAVPCFADDPLETLNTVEDTLSTMTQVLKTQAAEEAQSRADTYMLEAVARKETSSLQTPPATTSEQLALSPVQDR